MAFEVNAHSQLFAFVWNSVEDYNDEGTSLVNLFYTRYDVMLLKAICWLWLCRLQDLPWPHAEAVEGHHSVPQGPAHSKDLPLRVSMASGTETDLHDQCLQGKSSVVTASELFAHPLTDLCFFYCYVILTFTYFIVHSFRFLNKKFELMLTRRAKAYSRPMLICNRFHKRLRLANIEAWNHQKESIKTPILAFKVIQGHWIWWQSRASVRLPICN